MSLLLLLSGSRDEVFIPIGSGYGYGLEEPKELRSKFIDVHKDDTEVMEIILGTILSGILE